MLLKLEFFRQIFEKYSHFKIHENSSSGTRVVSCGQTDRQTDMTKLIVAFSQFANASKNSSFCPQYIFMMCIYLRRNIEFTAFNNWFS